MCFVHIFREVPAEPKTDTGLNIATDQPIDLEEPELLDDHLHSGEDRDVWILVQLHKDLNVQPEELEMCKDVDQNADPEQSEAVNNQEAPVQEGENAPTLENSPEREEVTENLEEMNCSEHQKRDQTASQDILPLENAESEQQETIEKPAKDSDSLSKSLETEPMKQSTCVSGNPQQPGDPGQPEQTASVEAEIPRLQEQAGPSEQDEQSAQPTLSGTNKTETSEQLSSETEVTQQTEEANSNPPDKPEGMWDQAADVVATDDGDVQKVVDNGEQHETSDPAAPYMNGGEVDREKARKLAESLFNLDNVERADVVKHIDKE